MEDHFFELDKILRDDVLKELAAMDLENRMSEHLAGCKQLVEAANDARDEAQAKIAELTGLVIQRDIEIQQLAEQRQSGAQATADVEETRTERDEL